MEVKLPVEDPGWLASKGLVTKTLTADWLAAETGVSDWLMTLCPSTCPADGVDENIGPGTMVTTEGVTDQATAGGWMMIDVTDAGVGALLVELAMEWTAMLGSSLNTLAVIWRGEADTKLEADVTVVTDELLADDRFSADRLADDTAVLEWTITLGWWMSALTNVVGGREIEMIFGWIYRGGRNPTGVSYDPTGYWLLPVIDGDSNASDVPLVPGVPDRLGFKPTGWKEAGRTMTLAVELVEGVSVLTVGTKLPADVASGGTTGVDPTGDSGILTDNDRCTGSLSSAFSIPAGGFTSDTAGGTTVCFATPNRSSRRAFGCKRCGWSASGMASTNGVWNGSGGGHPRHSVDSDLWKNGCLRPTFPPSSLSPSILSVSIDIAVFPSSSCSSFSFSSWSCHEITEIPSRRTSVSVSVPLLM